MSDPTDRMRRGLTRKQQIAELCRWVTKAEQERDAANEEERRCKEAREYEREWNKRLRPSEAESRIATLAIVLMLQDRLDALPVTEFAHVKKGFAEQERIDRLCAYLGEVTDEETAAATALWDETAT